MTLAATVTLVLAFMVVLSLAETYGLVRRLALHAAAFVTVAPRTSRGIDTAVAANKRRADSIAVTRMYARGERPGRGMARGKTDTSLVRA